MLVHVTVIAMQLVRLLRKQRRMREEAEAAHAGIHADNNHALFGQGIGGIERRLTVDQRTTENPRHHRQRTGGAGRTPDI